MRARAARSSSGCRTCRRPVLARVVGRALGMGDAAPGRHQVHGARRDLQRVALAVAMHDAAVEQIGDGRKPDMRMRAHIHALPGDELHRPQLVEEDERPDHLPLAMRQRAAHLEAAEVAGARHDDEFERVAGALVAQDRVLRRAASSWPIVALEAGEIKANYLELYFLHPIIEIDADPLLTGSSFHFLFSGGPPSSRPLQSLSSGLPSAFQRHAARECSLPVPAGLLAIATIQARMVTGISQQPGAVAVWRVLTSESASGIRRR